MMEVEAAADGAADLLMECDEEELEVWPQSTDTDEEEEDEGEALNRVSAALRFKVLRRLKNWKWFQTYFFFLLLKLWLLLLSCTTHTVTH